MPEEFAEWRWRSEDSFVFYKRVWVCFFQKMKGNQLSRVISSTDTFGYIENGHNRILHKMGLGWLLLPGAGLKYV